MNAGKACVKCLVLVVVAALLGGCMTTRQERSMEPKGFLVDPAILSRGEDDQALYRYRNPAVDLKKYPKVIIEPVKFYKPANASPEELADLNKLANNFNGYLFRELAKEFFIMKEPEVGTLRIETAITEAGKSSPGMDFISTVLPVGLAVSMVKDFSTGKPASVGEISGELKITDAMTGELVAAAVDSRMGGKTLKGIFSSWSDADNAMEYWAVKLRYVLCMEWGLKKCDKPSNY